MDHSTITQQEDQGISIHTGFPNPAIDAGLQALNLNKLLIKNGASTFMMRVRGDDWQSLGIWHDDIALVDRAVRPQRNDIAIGIHEGNFLMGHLPAMPKQAIVWGVVTTIIHQYRKGDVS